MARRLLAFFTVLLFAVSAAWASDVANFVNLGFSTDSATFMFAQYGIRSDSSKPFAEIFAVDVARNEFVRSGVQRRVFDTPVTPGQSGSGALYALLPTVSDLIESHHIDHLRTGRLVYLLVNGEEPRTELSFRDFGTGNRYEINLRQSRRGEGENLSAAFHIQVSATLADGSIKAYTVGLPNFFREGIGTYRIKQIILGPDERSLVFVMEMLMPVERGNRIRYMVETVKID